METLVINIPDKKSVLVKQILKELGVTINSTTKINDPKKNNTPNTLTIETIENAHRGVGLDKPIKNISDFIKNL
jgi:hypothetical protein